MKLTKKVLAVLLAALMVVVAAFAGCSASKSNDDSKEPSSTDAKTVKFGLILFMMKTQLTTRTSSQLQRKLPKLAE